MLLCCEHHLVLLRALIAVDYAGVTLNGLTSKMPRTMTDPNPVQLSGMFIRSTDTLCGTVLDQTIPAGWNDRPPMLPTHNHTKLKKTVSSSLTYSPDTDTVGSGESEEAESPKLLKGVIRKGVPPALRCAVWLSNIVQTVHPHQPHSYWHEYRTLTKARVLDNAYDKLLQSIWGAGDIPVDNHYSNKTSTSSSSSTSSMNDPSIWANMKTMNYGRSTAIENELMNVPPSGKMALQKVLLALDQVLGFEHAPMIPRLTMLLLSVMSESYAFTAVRVMAHNVSYYIPSHKKEYAAWCGAFGILMRKIHKSTYDYLYDRGILEVDNLKPLFQDFFVGILQPHHILRILDIYTLEGKKALYRFGIALLDLFKTESAVFQMIARPNEFWEALKLWTHDPRFNFEFLVKKAFGAHGRGPSRGFGRGGAIRVFPRRQILARIIKMEYARICEQHEIMETVTRPPVRPLGLVQPPPPEDPRNEPVRAILTQPIEHRRHLAEWLPLSLRLTNLELIFSTNHHGRMLETFYSHVKRAKHTVVLCEVLTKSNYQCSSSSERSSTNNNNNHNSNEKTIIGMYASQAWRVSNHVYGDGECFLFRLSSPKHKAQCWTWRPRVHVDDADFEVQGSSANALLFEQFMVSTHSYIAMGGSPDGSSGLRLNEDLTKGDSSSAAGFDNEPLVENESIFDVGLVEVYDLVSPW